MSFLKVTLSYKFLILILFYLTVSVKAQTLPPSCPLRKQVGQMFMVGVSPSQISPEFTEKLRSNNIGGVMLMGRSNSANSNCLKKGDLKKTISDLQRNMGNSMFVAVDQEGGVIQTFGKCNGFKDLVSHEEIGKKGKKYAYQAAHEAAQELKEVGINWNFSPVLDVNSNPDSLAIAHLERSLSTDPQKVADLGAEMIKGIQNAGLVSTAKHFPGHGAITEDSHRSSVKLNKTRAELNGTEFIPFKKAIANNVDSIMIGHITLPKIYGDKSEPASLNEELIQKLLRRDLKYDGLLITDDLDMKAVRSANTPVQAAKKAILAGEDMIMFVHNKQFEKIIDGLCEELSLNNEESQRLANRIKEANERIRNLKIKKRILPSAKGSSLRVKPSTAVY